MDGNYACNLLYAKRYERRVRHGKRTWIFDLTLGVQFDRHLLYENILYLRYLPARALPHLRRTCAPLSRVLDGGIAYALGDSRYRLQEDQGNAEKGKAKRRNNRINQVRMKKGKAFGFSLFVCIICLYYYCIIVKKLEETSAPDEKLKPNTSMFVIAFTFVITSMFDGEKADSISAVGIYLL